MKPNSRIFVAGHRGMVGSAIVRKLEKEGYKNLILKTRQELDLLNQAAVNDFFSHEKIEYVYLAAARVGGIIANSTYQADFLYENLVLATNILHAAAEANVEKVLYLGSSCIYPRMAPQPIKEESLLTGPLEATNEGYAIAKIAGLKLCEMYQRQYKKRFISAMPTNLYGPGDNFHPVNSHVIPALLRRFHEAKTAKKDEVTVWGTGTPMREFLHCDDLADALFLLMQTYEDKSTVNVGTGQEVTIAELAEIMKETTHFAGKVNFDKTKPDGTPRKVVDVTRLRSFGWEPRHALKEGLASTYAWAVKNGKF